MLDNASSSGKANVIVGAKAQGDIPVYFDDGMCYAYKITLWLPNEDHVRMGMKQQSVFELAHALVREVAQYDLERFKMRLMKMEVVPTRRQSEK
jgi:hypothetical protein